MVERNSLTKLDRIRNGTMVKGCDYESVSQILEEQKG